MNQSQDMSPLALSSISSLEHELSLVDESSAHPNSFNLLYIIYFSAPADFDSRKTIRDNINYQLLNLHAIPGSKTTLFFAIPEDLVHLETGSNPMLEETLQDERQRYDDLLLTPSSDSLRLHHSILEQELMVFRSLQLLPKASRPSFVLFCADDQILFIPALVEKLVAGFPPDASLWVVPQQGPQAAALVTHLLRTHLALLIARQVEAIPDLLNAPSLTALLPAMAENGLEITAHPIRVAVGGCDEHSWVFEDLSASQLAIFRTNIRHFRPICKQMVLSRAKIIEVQQENIVNRNRKQELAAIARQQQRSEMLEVQRQAGIVEAALAAKKKQESRLASIKQRLAANLQEEPVQFIHPVHRRKTVPKEHIMKRLPSPQELVQELTPVLPPSIGSDPVKMARLRQKLLQRKQAQLDNSQPDLHGSQPNPNDPQQDP
ncbi:MAG: hypothetical protein Q8P67_26755 [archaeon]|nr:hypothetical protein [archaeon]